MIVTPNRKEQLPTKKLRRINILYCSIKLNKQCDSAENSLRKTSNKVFN